MPSRCVTNEQIRLRLRPAEQFQKPLTKVHKSIKNENMYRTTSCQIFSLSTSSASFSWGQTTPQRENTPRCWLALSQALKHRTKTCTYRVYIYIYKYRYEIDSTFQEAITEKKPVFQQGRAGQLLISGLCRFILCPLGLAACCHGMPTRTAFVTATLSGCRKACPSAPTSAHGRTLYIQ